MRGIEIEDLYRFYSLGRPLLGEGGRGVCLKWRPDREENGYRAGLWSLKDGVFEPVGEEIYTGLISFLRNGRVLAGVREEEPGEGALLREIDLDTGAAAGTVRLPVRPEKFMEAEDGSLVLQADYKNAPEDETCLVIDELPYCANGRGIVNKVRRCLFWYDRETGRLSPITEPLFETERWTLSEDGRFLLYAGYTPDGKGQRLPGLYLADLRTGQKQCLAGEGRWRIDGLGFLGQGPRLGVVIAASDQKRYGMDENPCLFMVDLQGNMRLLASFDGPVTGSSVNSDCRYGAGEVFQTDGGDIYFVTTWKTRSALVRVREGLARVYEELPQSPDWISVRNGLCLMAGSEGQGLQELYLVDLRDEKPRVKRLTDFTGESLKGLLVGKPRPLKLEYGGREIDGWVLEPAGFQPGGKYPAILEIHGGPKTVYGNGFHHEMQLLAARGYFVCFCNPSGSDGKGDAFADIRGGYGERDYRELMAFMDRVLEAYPAVDRRRLGVTGGSYGGFMTNWIIGHTDRFAAAVSQRCMANLITIQTTTDIGHYSVADHQRADISRNFEDLWRQSPLRCAWRCTTPTLFLHSDQDWRCWQAEAMQMFSELKSHGVQTRLCLFKGEDHDLSRKGRPGARVRRLEELCGWMDRYLSGEE